MTNGIGDAFCTVAGIGFVAVNSGAVSSAHHLRGSRCSVQAIGYNDIAARWYVCVYWEDTHGDFSA